MAGLLQGPVCGPHFSGGLQEFVSILETAIVPRWSPLLGKLGHCHILASVGTLERDLPLSLLPKRTGLTGPPLRASPPRGTWTSVLLALLNLPFVGLCALADWLLHASRRPPLFRQASNLHRELVFPVSHGHQVHYTLLYQEIGPNLLEPAGLY